MAACGEEGVREGATVAVYVSGPSGGGATERSLCAEAGRSLSEAGNGAGEVRIRLVCLDLPEDGMSDGGNARGAGGGGRSTLAAVGANARRAAEDSTAVAYIGEPDPAAARFSAPILEAAGIAQLPGSSGSRAMSRLLAAIRSAGDSGALREDVQDQLGG